MPKNQTPDTPRKFLANVKKTILEFDGDFERQHVETDILMERLLITLGYQSGVAMIRTLKRPCS